MSDISLLNLKTYTTHFDFKNNTINWDNKYVVNTSDADHDNYGCLAGELDLVDTPLEFALLSYYSQAVLNIRPVNADTILPVGNPRLADLKLGAALFQEIQVLRFLADNNAVTRYEGMLKFITDRGNVTRAEIETHFRSGIRGLISEIVSEEFNKVSFLLRNVINQQASSYGAVLMRNAQTGHYTLSYEGYFNGTRQTKTLTAALLEALSSAMSGSGDFSQAAINEVRAQAALIPAVVYAGWRPGGVDAIALITETLTNFYLNPSQTTYEAVRGIYARYASQVGNEFAATARVTYVAVLNQLNAGLTRRIINDRDLIGATRIPNDARFNVFAERYDSGNR